MRCPLCHTILPDNAEHCTHCDWVRRPHLPRSEGRNWCAAALSFVPGLGHLYKGHLIPGLFLLCVAGPAFLLAVMFLIRATFGLSLILPAVFITFTAVPAFHLLDVRKYPGTRQQAIDSIARWMPRFARGHVNRKF
jgi:hypothetical protein